ncbi:MAG: MFS transporter [Syntrophobacteraceae bacterium CG2_30_61_12]|nr:MAG: MFS transporter [Syntrophobacteraceae bacterium CG2_30_61_12]
MRMAKSAHSTWQRTLRIMFVAQLITAVGFSVMFPFLPLYVKDLGSSTGLSLDLLAGLVFSSQAFTMMLASPVWGTLADRYGRKLMVERAMFGGALVLLAMAFVRTAEELVLLRALQGLVTGTIGAANALVAATVPRERTGYAMGLLQVALGAGVALGPLLGGVVADRYGYRTAFYLTSVLLLVAGFMVLFGVKEAARPVRAETSATASVARRWRSILAAPGVMVTYLLRFVNQSGRVMFLPVLPLFIEQLMADAAVTNTFTGLVIGVAAASTTVSAVFLGRLGDRIGHAHILLVCSLASALFYLLQSLVTRGWQLLALQALAGVAVGGLVPAISALLAHYTPPGDEGAVYGLDNSINSGARALAPMLGVSVGALLGLRATFVLAAVLYVLAAAVAQWGLKPVSPPISKRDFPAPRA